MILKDTYDGSNDPFEGDKTLLWTTLPSGAKVSKARLTLTPVQVANGTLFQERIRFQGSQGDWNSTKAIGANGNSYVEIDFHNRRTLVSVDATGVDGASLQVDMGGVFVEINDKGAIKTPTDPNPFSLSTTPPAARPLPGLTVSKFRLLVTAGSPDIASVVIRSTPSNINVRLGKMATFWPRIGDLVTADVSPDFADLLQVFLNTAEVKNGFYVIPLVIHSDSIARLQADLEVEYIQQAEVLPDAVKEVVLPFDYASLPKAQAGVLSVDLPPTAHVVAGQTAAKIIGAFEDSRVVSGPTGEIFPTGTVTISENDSQAQCFALDSATSATAVDLYLAVAPPGITVTVDLRTDFDGKPDRTSLLGSLAQATIPSLPDRQAAWISIPLGKEFHFLPKSQKYWLVVQSLQGSALWSVAPAGGGVVMQHTQDGALSWRETPAPAAATPPAGYFRLRNRPTTYQVPIELQAGSGKNAKRVKLDRFQPLGRVDFNLDIPEVADVLNQYLTAAPPTCSQAEHLANNNFEQWIAVGEKVGTATSVKDVSGSVGAIAISGDGSTAYIGLSDHEGPGTLLPLDVACNRVGASIDLVESFLPQEILLYPDGSKALIIGDDTIALADLRRLQSLGSTRFPWTTSVLETGGSYVYVASSGAAAGDNVFGYETPSFEAALLGGLLGQLITNLHAKVEGSVVALATDQKRLYVLSAKPAPGLESTLTFLDRDSFAKEGDALTVGANPLAVAIAPNGATVVVLNANNSLAIIDAESRAVRFVQVRPAAPLGQGGVVVVSADAKRAFVLTQRPAAGESTLEAVDLAQRTVTPLNMDATFMDAMAITPQADELLIGGAGPQSLLSALIGQRLPADWFVTSGQIELLCLSEVLHTHIGVAMTASIQPGGAIQPSAFSQVAPITGGCTYEFSFEALTDDRDAVAEILWRTTDGGSAKTDSVPLPMLSDPNAWPADPTARSARDFSLTPVRTRLVAPATAIAAEVRFTVPNEQALVAAASLTGSPQVLLNGTLQQIKNATPEQWILSPTGATGFSVTATSGKVVLRNSGPNAVDLSQSTAAREGQNVQLHFNGQGLPAAGSAVASVELRWLKSDGTAAGPVLREDIVTGAFEGRALSGKAPNGASSMEIHVALPPGTAMILDELILCAPAMIAVPLTFVAQSPGELRVSVARVGYDTAAPAAPPVPAGGLGAPTPPGALPGKQAEECSPCACCAGETETENAVPMVTPAGRPMTMGVCADCGDRVIRGGGVLVRGSPSLPVRLVSRADRPLVSPAPRVRMAMPPLTEVLGIGKTRAKSLKSAGIKTVQDLAMADPAEVAEVIRGVSASNAALLIRHARDLLAARG